MYVPTYNFGYDVIRCKTCGRPMALCEDETRHNVLGVDIYGASRRTGLPLPTDLSPTGRYDILVFLCGHCEEVSVRIAPAASGWHALTVHDVMLYKKPDWLDGEQWLDIASSKQVQARRNQVLKTYDIVRQMLIREASKSSPYYAEITRRVEAGEGRSLDFIFDSPEATQLFGEVE